VTGDSLLLVPSMGGSLTLHVLPDPGPAHTNMLIQ